VARKDINIMIVKFIIFQIFSVFRKLDKYLDAYPIIKKNNTEDIDAPNPKNTF
tara:strand:+ start:487 stop:645 length:159 start_codon:yes stop_codon:yes gene_type:complete